jgi:hypothetical protein
MKKEPVIILGLLIILGIFACKNDKMPTAAPISFESITLKDSTAKCEEANCFKGTIQYLVAKGTNTAVAQSISDTIAKYTTSSLAGYIQQENPSIKTVAEALQYLRKDFNELEAEQNKLPADERYAVYEVEIETREAYRNSKVICIEQNGYFNTGGAHPNSHISLFTFDALTGKTLELKDLMIDEKGFIKVVEEYLRQSHEVKPNETLADAGFLEMESLPIPVDYAVTSTGLRVIYNTYEIAPYATGASGFEIPFSALEKVLKLDKLK